MDKQEQLFKEYLSRNRLSLTEPRRVILRTFLSSDSHLSAEEIYDTVMDSGNGISVGIATVWRTMRLIKQAGLAEEHYFGDGVVRYEKRSPKRHGHLVCADCGKVIEFDETGPGAMLRKIAAKHNFDLDSFEISVFGRCRGCSSL
jgi:Fur family ferric uptake transcriptional regulator